MNHITQNSCVRFVNRQQYGAIKIKNTDQG